MHCRSLNVRTESGIFIFGSLIHNLMKKKKFQLSKKKKKFIKKKKKILTKFFFFFFYSIGVQLFGFDAELYLKRKAQEDPERSKKILEWIETVTGMNFENKKNIFGKKIFFLI